MSFFIYPINCFLRSNHFPLRFYFCFAAVLRVDNFRRRNPSSPSSAAIDRTATKLCSSSSLCLLEPLSRQSTQSRLHSLPSVTSPGRIDKESSYRLFTMLRSRFVIPLCLVAIVINYSTLSYGEMVASNVLYVGQELQKESLHLRMGSRLYQLQGLKSNNWYEVKISYPASIPASFSLNLRKGNVDLGMNRNRRLLNTEKLIFKADNLDVLNDQGGLYVLVTVEPEGFIAIPHAKEREFVIFNIVCDELLLGIPHAAWRVVILVSICLIAALIIPYFLPSSFLPKKQNPQSDKSNLSKVS